MSAIKNESLHESSVESTRRVVRRGRATGSTSSECSHVSPAPPEYPVRGDSMSRAERILKDKSFPAPNVRRASPSPPPTPRAMAVAPFSTQPRAISSPSRTTVTQPARDVTWGGVGATVRRETPVPPPPRSTRETRSREEPETRAVPRPPAPAPRARTIIAAASPIRVNREDRWGVPPREEQRESRQEIPRLTRRCGVSPPPEKASSVRESHRYTGMTHDEQDTIRAKFVDRFLILQRKFPDWKIPIPSEDSSLEYIHTLYDSYVKQINVHANSTNFKIFLIVLFIGIEFAAKRFGCDLTGYAKMQLNGMSRYQSVLLELGEKYTGEGEGEWPVEARIVFIAVIQAGIFFVARYAERFTNSAGFAQKVHATLDSYVDSKMNAPADEAVVDPLGVPIAAGTEDDIAGLESGKAKPADSGVADLGSILGGLMGGGGGGLDIKSLMSVASKFVANSPASPPARASPGRVSPRRAAPPVYSE